jgi:hypothetical protein
MGKKQKINGRTLVAQASSLCKLLGLPGETCPIGKSRVEYISSPGGAKMV